MSRQISELETILQQMIGEHRKLLGLLDTHLAAMKTCQLAKMDELSVTQEACRLRIAGLDQKRKLVVAQIGKELRLSGEVTLRAIATACPARAQVLNKLRVELKDLAEKVRTHCYISGRVANAVLGHLNTVVRLVAGAVEKAGLYNKRGVPRVANRIGVMEAVG